MKFDDELVNFIYSLTSVKKPIEKNNKFHPRYEISKEEGIKPVKNNHIAPGEITEDDDISLEVQYSSYKLKEISNMNNESIIKKEE